MPMTLLTRFEILYFRIVDYIRFFFCLANFNRSELSERRSQNCFAGHVSGILYLQATMLQIYFKNQDIDANSQNRRLHVD